MTRVALALLAACGSPPAGQPDADNGVAIDDRSGPTDDQGAALPEVERPTEQAEWAVADLEAAVSVALAEGVPDPWTLQDEYLQVLSNGDPGCPGHDTYIDDTHLYGCTAGTGWFYSGVSEWHQEEGEEEGVYWEGIEALGDFLFRSPAGGELEVGGHALWRYWRDDSFSVIRITTEHSGSWKWEEHDGWLSQVVSGLYTMDLHRDDNGSLQAIFDGAMQVWGVDFAFDALTLSEACDWAPSGAVSVRDPSGAWHRVDYGDTCSPCGQASFRDAPTGEACLDFSGVVDHLLPLMEEL